MGGSSSKRSGPGDAGSNLLWSLEQLAQWEERLTEDERFLTDQLSRGSLSSGIGNKSGTSLGRGEKSDVPLRSSDASASSGIGMGGVSSTFTKGAVGDVPSSSSLFGKTSWEKPSASIGGFTGTDNAGAARANATQFFQPSVTDARQGEVLVPAGGATNSLSQEPIVRDTVEREHMRVDENLYGRVGTTNTGSSTNAGITSGVPGTSAVLTAPSARLVQGAPMSHSSVSSVGPHTQGGTFFSPSSPTGASSRKNIDTSSGSHFGTGSTFASGNIGSSGAHVPPAPPVPSDINIERRPAERMAEARSFDQSQSGDMETMKYDDNIFLPQKFHFAYEALQRLVAGAERNFRLVCRINNLRDLAKNEKQPLNKLAFEKKVDILNMQLDNGLAAWDNACEACDWLRRDYDYALRWVKLSYRMKEIQAERAVLFGQRQITPIESMNEEERKMRQASDAELRSKSNILLGQTNDVRKQLTDLTQEIAGHQRQSLSIGLLFMDKNKTGALEAADIPHMGVELFSALDIGNHHSVSAKELQDSVDRLLAEVAAGQKELRELETTITAQKEEEQQRELQLQGGSGAYPRNTTDVEKLQADILKKQERYSILFSDVQRKRKLLDQIYHVFGQAFIKQVLKSLDTPANEVIERMNQLIITKQQEDHGVAGNYTINRQWQPPVDV